MIAFAATARLPPFGRSVDWVCMSFDDDAARSRFLRLES